MKRLVLCFDGTWNAVDDPATVTNVVKFAQAIKRPRPTAPSRSSITTRAWAAAAARPYSRRSLRLRPARQREARAGLPVLDYEGSGSEATSGSERLDYDDGDEVYLFGFSRGAYTARALSAVIGGAGIPTQMDFHELEKVWNYYRLKPNLRPIRRDQEPRVASARQMHRRVGHRRLVRDPVGLRAWRARPRAGPWTRGFHDREFGRHIDVGLHAMAVDEMRRPFKPTMWMRRKDDAPLDAAVKQVWFAGAIPRRRRLRALRPVRPLAHLDYRTRERPHGAGVRRERDRKRLWPCSACTLYLPTVAGRSALRSRRAGGIGGQAQAPALVQEDRDSEAINEGALERHRASGLRCSPGRGSRAQYTPPAAADWRTRAARRCAAPRRGTAGADARRGRPARASPRTRPRAAWDTVESSGLQA